MWTRWLLTCLLIFAASACEDHEKAVSTGGTPSLRVQPAPAQSELCSYRVLGRIMRPGEDLQFVFSVKANASWCFGALTLSGLSSEGQAIADPPLHGTLRLSRNNPLSFGTGAIVMGYRPAAGYVGSDQFRVSVPIGGNLVYLAGHVTVEP